MERILTKNFTGAGPISIDEYEKNGGYSAFKKALSMDSAEIIKIIEDSKLKGRGGAGFPTATKWKAMPPVEAAARPRYLAVNFDEMEPGTFKDRFLGENDPHQLIEGMLIAAWACKIDIGYIFLRAEYFKVTSILKQAIGEARDRGYIGKNILASGWDFDISIHESAGRYMCGEETGLLNALEGKRANPRAKPPFPMASGAWGRPTLINNVETLSCVPHIIEMGAQEFIKLGKGKDSGTKIYGVSGRVKKPGAWELPMGTTMRELIYEHAGGMLDGYNFRAALPGGASTQFLGEDMLDYPLDFESMKEKNLFFGTGTAVVLDDKTCPVGMIRNLEMFFARESCGWCTPCREGLPWIEKILDAIETGSGHQGDIEMLADLAKYAGPNTFCALALGAVQPLESGLKMFREDFEEHIRTGKCRYHK